MSNVALTIGGRGYRVACADGEEAHIAQLGRLVNEAVTAIGGTRMQSELQTLLFAALTLADELHGARLEIAASAGAGQSDAAQPDQDAVAARIDRLADRLEAFAERLELAAGNP